MMKTTITHTILLVPGTLAESEAINSSVDSVVDQRNRLAEAGGGWTWRVILPPDQTCQLSFQAEGVLDFKITTNAGKPLVNEMARVKNCYTTHFKTPPHHHQGDPLLFVFQANRGRIAIRYFSLSLALPDTNGDGISDWVAGLMGFEPEAKIEIVPKPPEPHTSFFYAWRYDPAMAVPTDAIRLYFWATNDDPVMFPNWAAKGYNAQAMLHSRFAGGKEVKAELPDVQRDRNGKPMGVHLAQRGDKTLDLIVPVVTDDWKIDVARRFGDGFEVKCTDYYRVPNSERDQYASLHYAAALDAGTTGFGYDEPEFWTYSGYSETFKQEWLSFYGTPWLPPHSSIEARYMADQLKGYLFTRQTQTILQDVEKRSPSTIRLLSAHSPINYYLINIACRHHQMIMMPEVQEVIAEVWTGTARVPVPLEGIIAERTFEVGFLEYSSFCQLLRGLGKRLWFLHDPLEDRPNLPLEDYHRNYVRTVVASLMFPEVDNYEVLVWPNRIFGCVPKEYETLINTVVGALCELWRYPEYHLEAGSHGIGTFVADSMAWQRDDPSPSDYNDFWGITLPLVSKGVPIQVLSLDRVADPGYLDGFKLLLVCYDFLKPASPKINQALADWVNSGGTLLFLGGTDAYNAMKDSWWQQAGFASPGEDLFARMGIPVRQGRAITVAENDLELKPGRDNTFTHLHTLKIPSGKPQDRSQRQGGSIVLLPEQTGGYCQVTLFDPPANARPLYFPAGESLPAVWEANTGKGILIFAGSSPRFMAITPQGAEWLRTFVQYGYEKTGEPYREQPYFRIKRGPYSAISALDQAYTAEGLFVDLFSPTLSILENPVVPAHECAFWVDAKVGGATPQIMAISGRMRACVETSDSTAFLSQSPNGTEGVARLWSGERKVKNVSAVNVLGEALPANYAKDGKTILVRYSNDADGTVVQIDWE